MVLDPNAGGSDTSPDSSGSGSPSLENTSKPVRTLKKAKLLSTPEIAEGEPSERPATVSSGHAQPLLVSQLLASGNTVESVQDRILQKAKQRAREQTAASSNADTPIKASKSGPASAGKRQTDEEEQAEPKEFHWTSDYSCWSTSLVVHMVLLVVLGLWALRGIESGQETPISYVEPDLEEEIELEELDLEKETPEIEPEFIKEAESEQEDEVHNADDLNVITDALDDLDGGEEVANLEESTEVAAVFGGADWFGEIPVPAAKTPGAGNAKANKGGEGTGQGTGGKGTGAGGRAARRKEIDDPYDYEPTIERSLVWLARHQVSDGGWTFQHHLTKSCKGQCGNPGNLGGARYAATGLALLPFLGAGYTHQEGPYKKQVLGGLKHLMRSQTADGGLWGPQGRMYGHGIATLALCEAFAMAKDAGPNSDAGDIEAQMAFNKQLGRAAKRAANYISAAQSANGGWRYKPKELGDTSVVGWQVMALKAAKDAGLAFNQNTRQGAIAYLNRVQANLVGDQHYGIVGTEYFYQRGSHRSRATSAIGMLCRVYMGLPAHHPAVIASTRRMLNNGHGGGDMYFKYYATQLMHQAGGDVWKQWNQSVGGHLKGSQAHGGHLEGSWYFADDPHGSGPGGRLYCTVLALLCLEENYRHLRIADGHKAVEELEEELLEEPDKKKESAADAKNPG
ncbi:MAG: prenyltransferase/squalene oxidase repeat-containing protein [Pirellulales bacterium]